MHIIMMWLQSDKNESVEFEVQVLKHATKPPEVPTPLASGYYIPYHM